ncbi:hypothetical protein BR93DRAFT_921996 [Coniochaeta sp. PMI_546]|nr:hypothetical protein BR93DRAFT_921996 [Coniochaeta sp. PMI_546]
MSVLATKTRQTEKITNHPCTPRNKPAMCLSAMCCYNTHHPDQLFMPCAKLRARSQVFMHATLVYSQPLFLPCLKLNHDTDLLVLLLFVAYFQTPLLIGPHPGPGSSASDVCS